MKKLIPLILAAAILLTSCGTVTVTNKPASDPGLISVDSLLTRLLDAVPEGEETPQILSDEELEACLLIYGIDSALVQNCAAVRLGGARVFELAVIDLTVPSYAAEDALLGYLKQRQGDFTGYAPDEAEIAANGKLFAVEGDRRLVLALTETPQAIARALLDAGYTEVTEVFAARQWDEQPAPSTEPEPEASTSTTPEPAVSSEPSPSPEPESSFDLPRGWYAYIDPHTDNMALYKNTFILSAWEAGTPEKLPEKDKLLYERCAEIIAQCVTEDMSDYEKELSIYRWMTWNIAYDWRHQDSFRTTPRDSYTPHGALVNGEAVCLGFATAFQLLMDMLDIECITVVGAAFNSSENHAWNMVKLGDEWYCVDATWDMGKNPERFNYFNVTSDYMAKSDHQWDYANVPMATATDHGINK